MTITISHELETRLRERATQEGQDVDTLAETLLSTALNWEAQERAEAIEGIQRGLAAGVAGRVRPAEEVFAERRAKLSQAQR
jgi:predicted transcriptional regulator